MLALRASSKPQELENASFEPLRSPRGSKMLERNRFSCFFEAAQLEIARKGCTKKRSKQRSKTLRSSYEAAGLEAA